MQRGPDGGLRWPITWTPMIESLLLTTTRVTTLGGSRLLSTASGFFFRRGAALFLVTSRHVLVNRPSGHVPDRVTVEVHADADNLTRVATLSIPLYRAGRSLWRQGRDSHGEIDVAVIPLDPDLLPAAPLVNWFTPDHLQDCLQEVEVGSALLVVGYPLGFHDGLHHLPVVRQAVIASSFGLRFQGQGCFLTDARTHRGTSGAPVVMRDATCGPELPWKLLGVHSARMDMSSRDRQADESLGLNLAWYADILMTLTAPDDPDQPDGPSDS